MKRYALALVLTVSVLIASPASAVTSGISATHSPGAVVFGVSTANCHSNTKGAIRYDSVTNTLDFCNGTAWSGMVQSLTIPAGTGATGSGYFVLSYGTYNGGLGNFEGADASCLSDLTTNTGWMGYATANSNGQLIADKVHAFIADPRNKLTNGDLMPLTKYYFANALDGSKGGSYFTTDASGGGPNDAANWSGATYFGGSYTYWTGRFHVSATLWERNENPDCCPTSCLYWASSSSGDKAQVGQSGNTDSKRWDLNGSGTNGQTCDTLNHLICVVNP